MSEPEDRLNQLEALLNTQRALEAAIDTIDDNLARDPPRSIKRQLVARRNRIVAELDDVRDRINEIVARRGSITPPDAGTVREIGEAADRVEEQADQSQAAEGALAVANEALKTAEKVRGIG